MRGGWREAGWSIQCREWVLEMTLEHHVPLSSFKQLLPTGHTWRESQAH